MVGQTDQGQVYPMGEKSMKNKVIRQMEGEIRSGPESERIKQLMGQWIQQLGGPNYTNQVVAHIIARPRCSDPFNCKGCEKQQFNFQLSGNAYQDGHLNNLLRDICARLLKIEIQNAKE